MRRSLVLLAIAGLLASFASFAARPAAGATNVPKLALYCNPSSDFSHFGPCTIDIAANTPFYILQWWNNDDNSLTMTELQSVFFNLWVDGVQQKGSVWQQFTSTKPPVLIGRGNQYNFTKGLAVGQYSLSWTMGWTNTVHYTGEGITLNVMSCTTTKIRCGDTT